MCKNRLCGITSGHSEELLCLRPRLLSCSTRDIYLAEFSIQHLKGGRGRAVKIMIINTKIYSTYQKRKSGFKGCTFLHFGSPLDRSPSLILWCLFYITSGCTFYMFLNQQKQTETLVRNNWRIISLNSLSFSLFSFFWTQFERQSRTWSDLNKNNRAGHKLLIWTYPSHYETVIGILKKNYVIIDDKPILKAMPFFLL